MRRRVQTSRRSPVRRQVDVELSLRNPKQTFQAGKNGLPDRMTIARWRAKLNDPAQFEATYDAAIARYVKILELQQGAHVSDRAPIVERAKLAPTWN